MILNGEVYCAQVDPDTDVVALRCTLV